MLRVLVAQIPTPHNRFLSDLNAELSKLCHLAHSSDDFWQMRGDYDVVHFHWPEYSTFEIQDAYTNGLTANLIEETEKRLRFWADRSALIITRHNLVPHDAAKNPKWENMYELFYRYMDGVVHLANFSATEFRERYRDTAFFREQPPSHTIIPHPNYAGLPNTISREEARTRLRIPSKSKVMLVFGGIRNCKESQLILDTFHAIKVPNKFLLVSAWRENLARVSWIRLKYWLRDLSRLYYRLHPAYHFNHGFVEDADAQIYLNAADVLFIPRLQTLNSGNVALGTTFGRIVVGPDSGNVGEVLRQTGNPVFDPLKANGATAVEEGFQLAEEGRVGPANQQRALRDWGADHCAAQYLEFFRTFVAYGQMR